VAEGGAILAEFGEVARRCGGFGIAAPVFAAVVSLDAIGGDGRRGPALSGAAEIPAVERDLAFVIGADQSLTAAQIESTLREEAGPLRGDSCSSTSSASRTPVEPGLAASLPGRGPDADRRRGERDPGACGPRVTETFHITLRSS